MNFTSSSLKRLDTVHPDLAAVVRRAAQITEVPFQITEGGRTLARQKELVRLGASRTMRSRHLTGHAVDVVAYVGSRVSWEFPLYRSIAEAFKAASRELGIPVEWGGDWRSFKDGPHFQLPWKQYPAAGAKRPSPAEVNTLLIGSAGEMVIELQGLLIKHGAKLKVDGDFGPRTDHAVRAFQKQAGLTADGIVGPKTWAALKRN